VVEVVANLHMHTPYSDGAAYHDEIAAAASRAGLQAVIVTDHNVHVGGIERYRHGVLTLVGEEVHDALRRPQANHCLIYGAERELSPFARSPQQLIDEAITRGGMAFLAHPVEYPARLGIENGAFGWEDWRIKGYTGIELWNYMSEFKAKLSNWPLALLLAYFPEFAIRGPFRAALDLWDQLLSEGKRVVVIGNSDAHAVPFHLGPLRRVIFPYAYLFRCVNTHVLIDHPFTGDFETDKRLLLTALRAGRCFVGYDLPGSTRGFRFSATNGPQTVEMGSGIRRTGMLRFKIKTPAPATIRLLRNGALVAQGYGDALEAQSIEPGAYRVEVYRQFRGLNRGWIFSNPIYTAASVRDDGVAPIPISL
jgi:hypothetical protein